MVVTDRYFKTVARAAAALLACDVLLTVAVLYLSALYPYPPPGGDLPIENVNEMSASEFIFGGSITGYGQTLSPPDEEAFLVSRALRRVDVCGFVDLPAITASVPNITSYGPESSQTICILALKTDGGGPTGRGIKIELRADVGDGYRDTTWQEVQIGEVTMKKSQHCHFHLPLGLADVPGGPTTPSTVSALTQQYLEIAPHVSNSVPCDQVTAVATAAARIRASGIPRLSRQSKVFSWAFLEDPCSIFPGLTGFSGFTREFNSATRRNFTPADPHDSTTTVTIAVTTTRALIHSFTTETHDGVTLYLLPQNSPGNNQDCGINVIAGKPLQPAHGNTASDGADPGNKVNTWPVPVVESQRHRLRTQQGRRSGRAESASPLDGRTRSLPVPYRH